MHDKGLDTVPEIAAVLSEPSTSYWLRDALRAAMVRDPVDAANDAEVLARLLDERAYQCAGMARAMSHGF